MSNDITAAPSSDWPEKAAFLNAQYVALRQEVENAKQRAFYLYALGAIIVPATQQLLQYLTSELSQNVHLTSELSQNVPSGSINLHVKLLVIKLIFPLLVIGIIFLFLAENKGIKRCGRYIKENIEIRFNLDDQKIVGWETWLAENRGHQYAAFSFIVLFAIYYTVFATAGLLDIYINWSSIAAITIGVLYILIWLATQCYFVNEMWYDDLKYESRCPVYNKIFIVAPARMKDTLREIETFLTSITKSARHG